MLGKTVDQQPWIRQAAYLGMAFRLAHSQLAFQITPVLRNLLSKPYLNAKIELISGDRYKLLYYSF